MKRINLSIIIVNYKVKNELFNCLYSIYEKRPRINIEVIVVDNDEKKIIGRELRAKFREVKYIKSPNNKGFGGGNNLGALNAKGEYFFFLNPDTKVEKGAIDNLYNSIIKDKKNGIVAPLLIDQNREVYPLQGTLELTPLRAIFSLSFINKLFPNNPISRKYWLKNWNKKEDKNVDVVPGTAFVISKELFEKVGGFDEKFFLYFEEFDLCNRVRKFGLKIKIITSAKVLHIWESSSKKRNDIKKIFSKSRFYYFKKNYGLLSALIVHLFAGFGRNHFLLLAIILFGLLLRFYKLESLMIFMGDQGWFYLSARDLVVNHVVPLVGIPSSVVWLKQGALGTYFIAFALYLGKFDPVSPAMLFSVFDVLTIILIYILGKRLINEKTGLFAGLFYASSPLILVMARMPYHTSVIPFFACLFFLLLLNKKTNLNWFLIFLILGMLIQLELSNVVLFILLFFYSLIKKNIFKKANIKYSIIGFVIGILPFIIYDFTNKFIQTFGFPLWILNRIRLFFGLTVSGNATTGNIFLALQTMYFQFSQIIFPFSLAIFYILAFLILLSLILSFREVIKRHILLMLWLAIPLLGFLVHSAPGMAYFFLIFPAVCLLVGFTFNYYSKINKTITLFIFLIVVIINSLGTVRSDYFIWTDSVTRMPPNDYGFGPSYKYYDDVARVIVNDAKDKEFSVKGGAFLGKYSAGIDNFKYLILQREGKIDYSKLKTYTIYAKEDVGKNKSIEKNDKAYLYNNEYFFVFSK